MPRPNGEERQERVMGFIAQLVENIEIFNEIPSVLKKYTLIPYDGSVKPHKIYHITIEKPGEIDKLDLEKAKSQQITTGNIVDITIFSDKIVYLLDNKKHVTVAEGDGAQKCLNENKEIFRRLLGKQLKFSPPEIIRKIIYIFSIDEEQVRKYYDIITHNRKKNHQFQGFLKDGNKPRPKPTKYIDVKDANHLISLCKDYDPKGVLCISVNPTKPGIMKFYGIEEIANAVIDADVKDKRKINGVSTPEDKQVAYETMQQIRNKFEKDINLRFSAIFDTGNGYHGAIPLSVSLEGFFTGKNEDENKDLWDKSDIRGRLVRIEKIAKEFSNDVVEIDVITKDISRRIKVSGTHNVKPGIQPENYRMSRIADFYEDALTDLIIQGNTDVFNALEPVKEEITAPVTSATPKIQDLERLLKKDKKLRELYSGDWNREPYSLKDNGTPRERWTRSEAEHAILCKLIWYELPQDQIFQIMEGCKIGKWQESPDSYKESQYRSAVRYIDGHGGTKSAAQVIPIMNDDKQIASLRITGLNSYEVLDGDEVIELATPSKGTIWHGSPWYRERIRKALSKHFELGKEKAEKIAIDVCAKARDRIKEMKEKGAFTPPLDEDIEDIIANVVEVEAIPCRDSNEYHIKLGDGETIKLNDRDIVNGPFKFILEILNIYHNLIKIPKEAWEEVVVPALMEKLVITEERIEGNIDKVRKKFLQQLAGKHLHDWKDIQARNIGYPSSIFLDIKQDIVYVCLDLVQLFFEEMRIEQLYKINDRELLGNLKDKGFIIKKSDRQRAGDGHKTWWRFDAKRIGKTKEDIIVVDKGEKEVKLPGLNGFDEKDQDKEAEEEIDEVDPQIELNAERDGSKNTAIKLLEDCDLGKKGDIVFTTKDGAVPYVMLLKKAVYVDILSEYEEDIRRVEKIIGDDSHLTIIDIAKNQMHMEKIGEINNLKEVIDKAIENPSFKTTLKVDSKGLYYNKNEKGGAK